MVTEQYAPIWRVEGLEKRLAVIEDLRPQVMAFELQELRKDVASLRKALLTFSLTVAGSAIIFAFSVFALLGHP